MLNNLGPAFKIYLTVVNGWMEKYEKLEKNKVLFETIEEQKTCIKIEYKIFANFASIKSNTKHQKVAAKGKKEFVGWPKYKKCGCKHLANQIYKHANNKYDKGHKKRYISRFHNSDTSLNKRKILESLATASRLDNKECELYHPNNS